MRPIFITKSLTALDRDGIALAQTTAGAGNLTLAGALTSGGVFTSGASGQRVIGIYSAADLSAVTFTVYGTNGEGISISEAITGPSATTVSSVLSFYTVTRVAVSAAVGTNVEVGTTGVGATQAVPMDQHVAPFAVSLALEFAGTSNVTVQYTFDNIFASTALTSTGLRWTDHSSLTSKTAAANSNLAYPASAVRMVVNSGTDATTFIIRQAGIWG